MSIWYGWRGNASNGRIVSKCLLCNEALVQTVMQKKVSNHRMAFFFFTEYWNLTVSKRRSSHEQINLSTRISSLLNNGLSEITSSQQTQYIFFYFTSARKTALSYLSIDWQCTRNQHSQQKPTIKTIWIAHLGAFQKAPAHTAGRGRRQNHCQH